MQKLRQLEYEYFEILNQQKFDESDLDYSIFEQQIPLLTQMAQVKNSGLLVFDLFKKEHIFNSFNLSNLFGYDLEGIDNEYFNSRIHPEDYISLMQVGILVLKQFYKLETEEKKKLKLQNEYRILNKEEKYIRIIEQFQILELDRKGNIWLALSTKDISPNQEEYLGIRSQTIDLETGKTTLIFPNNEEQQPTLSKREKEIFNFVKDGLLSKEISEKLNISIHTVNTHRQNILKKLAANNSIEAIQYAQKLNLV